MWRLTDGYVSGVGKKPELRDVLSNVDQQMRDMMSDSLNLSFGLKSQHSCHYSLGQRCLVKITGWCGTKEERI